MASQNNIQSFTFSANFEAAQQALGAVIAIDEDLRDLQINFQSHSIAIYFRSHREETSFGQTVRTDIAGAHFPTKLAIFVVHGMGVNVVGVQGWKVQLGNTY